MTKPRNETQLTTRLNPAMKHNSLLTLRPYRHDGLWVFDDPATELVREPFVAGIDTILNRLTARIPDACQGFTLLFSASPFPGHQIQLDRGRSEYGGTWYYCTTYGIEGWLCPALFRYFTEAPAALFASAHPHSMTATPNP
jgi:hypothetical protein